MKKILLTSTSFQDTPGKHHEAMKKQNFAVDRLRGPLKDSELLPIIGKYDGIICGDDELNCHVIQKGAQGNLKVISKYGIGVDKIDIQAATQWKIPVTYCPGVNHITVAEHTFGLLLSLVRKIPEENNYVHKGDWKRLAGHDIHKKSIGILGLGRVGKEVAKRALCFGMISYAFDVKIDQLFIDKFNINVFKSPEAVLKKCDILTLHMPLNDKTRHYINQSRIQLMKKGVFIINTGRGALVNEKDMVNAIHSGHVAGYAADVVENEPIHLDNPLIGCKNVILTPHIASRTFENVERQAMMALENLINLFENKEPLALANQF
jgi:D-3-phosphoglycerate dehydrogenase